MLCGDMHFMTKIYEAAMSISNVGTRNKMLKMLKGRIERKYGEEKANGEMFFKSPFAFSIHKTVVESIE